MSKVQVDKELINRVKRIIIEFGSPTIAMSVLFEMLGYSQVNGIMWGVLLGVVSTVATEIGYEVTKLGSIWIIQKPLNKGTNCQKDNDDTGENK
jgi:hypothetical protein